MLNPFFRLFTKKSIIIKIDLEKRSYDYDDVLAPVTIDEVIMGHMLQTAQGQNTGLITMCIGGGMGMAMIIER